MARNTICPNRQHDFNGVRNNELFFNLRQNAQNQTDSFLTGKFDWADHHGCAKNIAVSLEMVAQL